LRRSRSGRLLGVPRAEVDIRAAVASDEAAELHRHEDVVLRSSVPSVSITTSHVTIPAAKKASDPSAL